MPPERPAGALRSPSLSHELQSRGDGAPAYHEGCDGVPAVQGRASSDGAQTRGATGSGLVAVRHLTSSSRLMLRSSGSRTGISGTEISGTGIFGGIIRRKDFGRSV